MGRRRFSSYNDSYSWYTPSKPKEVKGGIKAQSKKGSFGESWWARRWVEVLESFQIGERLNRGKRYARSRHVLSIDIAPGVVNARVQGSRATPYKVAIKIDVISKENRHTVRERLSQNFMAAAALSSGELPAALEEIFNDAGAPLFPRDYKDLAITCSCPDWSNPCKHGAAVCYLLAEELDRDPFLLLTLRGLERADLTDLSSAPEEPAPPQKAKTRGRKKSTAPCPGPESTPGVVEGDEPPVPLSTDPQVFWGCENPPEPLSFSMTFNALSSYPARRLGAFPFWRGQEHFQDAMEEIYGQVALQAPALLAGGQGA